MESAVTLLPEPDSPTMPTVWFFWMSKEIPSTALTVWLPTVNWVWRLSMVNSDDIFLFYFNLAFLFTLFDNII